MWNLPVHAAKYNKLVAWVRSACPGRLGYVNKIKVNQKSHPPSLPSGRSPSIRRSSQTCFPLILLIIYFFSLAWKVIVVNGSVKSTPPFVTPSTVLPDPARDLSSLWSAHFSPGRCPLPWTKEAPALAVNQSVPYQAIQACREAISPDRVLCLVLFLTCFHTPSVLNSRCNQVHFGFSPRQMTPKLSWPLDPLGLYPALSAPVASLERKGGPQNSGSLTTQSRTGCRRWGRRPPSDRFWVISDLICSGPKHTHLSSFS